MSGKPGKKPRLKNVFFVSDLHYENLPMQYTEICLALKIENFQLKNFVIFLIFAQNIDCGYALEPPRRGGSNEYPQSMIWSKIRKIGIPLHIPVLLYKSGVIRTCFHDALQNWRTATVSIWHCPYL